MNFDHLKYFLATAETLHTGRAARAVNVSQSAICHGIRKLENDLGQKLFSKVGKRLTLTEAGKRLSAQGQTLYSSTLKLKNDFRGNQFKIEGTFRVGVSHGLFGMLLKEELVGFQKQNPGCILEFQSLRSAEVVNQILAGQLDVGICYSPTTHPQIEISGLKKVALNIAVRRGHPLLKARNIMASVASFPYASPRGYQGVDVCEKIIAAAGIKSQPSFYFDSYDIAADYLKASDGWALMPANAILKQGLAIVNLPSIKAHAHIAVIVQSRHQIPQPLLNLLDSSLRKS